MMSSVSVVVVVLAAAIYAVLLHFPRSALPEHVLGHPVIFRENLVSAAVGKSLLEHMKEISVFPSNVAADLKTGSKVTSNEEIGEGQPLNAENGCDHPFLSPNVNKTVCVFPQRVDVGKSFIKSGGVDGLQELYETMISRTSSFGQYNFFVKNETVVHPAVSALFRSAKFQSVSEAVCPKHKQIIDPFQYNFIINVPGQSVPLHLDSPSFEGGGTRKNYPQWLLVAMVFSGFFKNLHIDTVQVVAYLHEWIPTKEQAGDFVYYRKDSSRFESIPALPLAGTGVDGTKTVHAARTYMPHATVPELNKDKDSQLVYKGGDEWDIQIDGESVKTYSTNDLRIAIVYRARCFESRATRDLFHEEGAGLLVHDYMTLDAILGTFTADLTKRGILTAESAQTISRLDLAILIMDTYIQYPLPDSSISISPYNICALARVYPSLKPALSLLCH